MKAVLYLSTNGREQEIGRALASGWAKYQVECELKTRGDFWETSIDADADIVGFVGVKSRKIFNDCLEQNKVPLIIDKGYFGRGDYYRVSLGGYQPMNLLAKMMHLEMEPARFAKVGGANIAPRQTKGTSVMYVGSSQKYCNFHELGDCNSYAEKVMVALREVWKGPIIYRPKPSWFAKKKEGERRDTFEKHPVIDAIFSMETDPNAFKRRLGQCKAIVTHGSNGAVEALAMGVPVIMLSEEGVSPVRDLCNTRYLDVHDPWLPSQEDRFKYLLPLSYAQFTIEEMASGYAWAVTAAYQTEQMEERLGLTR